MDHTLKNKIMRRVLRTWLWNKSKPIIFMQLPLMAIFLTMAHKYVAFKAVAYNSLVSLDSPTSVYYYTVSAFRSAEPLVAFLAVAAGIFGLLALNSIARNVIALSRKESKLPLKVDK